MINEVLAANSTVNKNGLADRPMSAASEMATGTSKIAVAWLEITLVSITVIKNNSEMVS